MQDIGSLRDAWAFQARSEELDLLLSSVERGVTDPTEPSGAVIVGPAGMGKSRLLRETLQVTRGRDIPTHLAIATHSASATPYAALAGIASQVPYGEHQDPLSWYRAIADALRSRPGPRPVVAIDDAHLLDHGSAALALHLLLTGAATVLLTLRRGETPPDPVTTMWKDSLALRIDLQPFSSQEIEQFIAAAFDGRIGMRTVRRLSQVSGGNLLFARELVFGAVDSGSLRLVDGVWLWDGQVVLAPRLVDAVGRRLEDLPAPDLETLGLIALGEPLLLRYAETVASQESLASLEQAGLAVITDGPRGGECRVAHPLYGEVALGQLGYMAKRRLRRSLVSAMQSASDADPLDVVRVATWQLDLEGEVDAEVLLEAATHANRAFDQALATRLARAARERGAGPDAAIELAIACCGGNRYDQAEAVLGDAEDEILTDATLARRQRYLMVRHQALYMGLGRRTDDQQMIERFERRCPASDHGGLAMASAFRSALALDEGRAATAAEIAQGVLAGPEPGPLPTLVALEVAGEALASQGMTQASRALHPRLTRLGAEGPPETRRAGAEAVLQEAMCRHFDGDVSAAVDITTAVRLQTLDDPDPTVRGLVATVLGSALLWHGAIARAEDVLVEAANAYRQIDVGSAACWVWSHLAQVRALAGRRTPALQALERARAQAPDPQIARITPDLVFAEAHVQWAFGDRRHAMTLAQDGAGRMPEMTIARARLLHFAAQRADRPGEFCAELQSLAEGVESPLPGLLSRHVAAQTARDPVTLLSVSQEYERRGLLIHAVESASQAARVLTRSGDHRRATSTSARVRTLLDRCVGLQLPGAVTTPSAHTLSRRELEVAQLAGQGLTNAEIAERLVVSVRTVESHLYQGFAKLGVTHRDQLADVLASPPPTDRPKPPSRVQ